MYGLCLLRRRCLARADRPDRLVRDDRVRESRDTRGVEHRLHLTLDNLLGSARLALVERFADAQDRNEPRLLRRLELLGDDRVALAEQRTALRVADDGVAAPDVGQHRAGYFAGERPAADPRRDVL